MLSPKWYTEGLRFQCTGCGDCCRSNGEYDYVYVFERDIEVIGEHLGLPGARFIERFCAEDGDLLYLDAVGKDCPFLENNRCVIYPLRPKQCATWPFWTENLVPDIWRGLVTGHCRGIGRGKLYSAREIEALASERDDLFSRSALGLR